MKKLATIISMVCLTCLPLLAQQSVKDLIKRAKKGDVKAQHNLGYNYNFGRNGLPQDYEKAFYWYEQAAKQGSAPSCVNLGFLYEEGQGTTKNLQMAEYWYKKGVYAGNKTAMYQLGQLYASRKLSKYDEGIKLLTPLANEGDYYAMNALGLAYNDLHENDKCIEWLTKSAEKGGHSAEANLGQLYLEGLFDFPIDYEKSIYWNKRAADAGMSAAKHNLPIAQYKQGDVLYQKKNYEEAVVLFMSAASNEDNPIPDAMRKLSACFRYGLGVPVDSSQEKYYMEEAAKHNDAFAMKILGF